MADERRSTSRILTSGIRVIYELASGERVEAAAEDLSSTGLFVQTVRSVAIGKRIALEIHLPGEAVAWSAVGRVVWVRGAAETAAAGMGVKFIDIDDAACGAFERLAAKGGPSAVQDGAAAIDLERSTVPFKLSTRKAPDAHAARPPRASPRAPTPSARSALNWIAVLAVAAFAAVCVYAMLSRARSASRREVTAPAEGASPVLAPPAPPPTARSAAPIAAAPHAAEEPPSASEPAPAAPSRPPRPAASPSAPSLARTAPTTSASIDAARAAPRASDDPTNPY